MDLKKITLSVFLCIKICSAYCQKNFEIVDAKDLQIEANIPLYTGKENIPYKGFVIKDFRFDTTKFGYFKNNKISFRENNSDGLRSFLNYHFTNNFDKNSDKTLFIVIKKLWIQKDAFDIVSSDKIRPKLYGTNKFNSGACIADIEVYCEIQNQFYPLIKITDNFFYYPYSQSQLANFILLPFDSLIKKATTIDIEKVIANRKPYTLEAISSNYSLRYEIPILTATTTTKGVFKTFDSFKKNETTYPDFTVKQTKLVDDLYIIENNKEELLTDFWGYYDGKDYYIKSGYGFYKLTRQNNSWDIYGSKFITETYSRISYGAVSIKSVAPTEVKKPLQLDMETGKLY